MFDFPRIEPARINIPEINVEPLPIVYSYSDTQVEIIKDYVLEFQQSLDPDREVALLLTHFGSSILMEVTHISYENLYW